MNMNMNMIVKMFTRLVIRRAMNWGIDKGLDTVSKARKPKQATLPPQIDDEGNPVAAPQGQAKGQGKAGRNNTKQARDMAKKMRTVNRMTRR